jgi:hypothetical protein
MNTALVSRCVGLAVETAIKRLEETTSADGVVQTIQELQTLLDPAIQGEHYATDGGRVHAYKQLEELRTNLGWAQLKQCFYRHHFAEWATAVLGKPMEPSGTHDTYLELSAFIMLASCMFLARFLLFQVTLPSVSLHRSPSPH